MSSNNKSIAMTEQQRVFLAVALTFGIIVGWQELMTELYPPPADLGIIESVTSTETQPAVSDNATDENIEAPAGAAKEAAAVAVAEAGTVVEPSAPSAPVVAEREVFFRGYGFKGALSNVGPRLTALELNDFTEKLGEDAARVPVSLVAGAHKSPWQAELIWKVGGLEQAIPMEFREEGGRMVLEGVSMGGQAQIKVAVEPSVDSYALKYDVQISNQHVAPVPAAMSLRLGLDLPQNEESSFLAPNMQIFNMLCAGADEIERFDQGDVDEETEIVSGPIRWAGIDRQYFVVAALFGSAGAQSCSASLVGETILVDVEFGSEALAPGATMARAFNLFLGPKLDDEFQKVGAPLTEVVDYSIMGIPLGFIARPMIWLMNIFHGMFGSWGLAILLLTIVVKTILFPVTYKSVVSMRKMQLLKPELDKIKERYPNDKEKQQMEQIRIFKERGVSPLGGCLPMLMQMPVWFALYRALWTSVDLYQQPFLWISDLTAKEPFPFLALALGAVTFIQQKVTPTTMDNDQAKMMMFMMPIMLTVFMLALPSGLVLYIFVNSLLTIVQQLVINKRIPAPA